MTWCQDRQATEPRSRHHDQTSPPGDGRDPVLDTTRLLCHTPAVLLWLAYSVFGCIAGVLAGALGVGGGAVVVPALLFLYQIEGLPPEFAVPSALGTSLAAICFTSASSLSAHHRRGAVEWRLVALITPGLLVGSFLGTFAATALPILVLRAGFVVFLVVVCLRMYRSDPAAELRRLPRRAAPAELLATGSGIGMISALVGIGGGSLSVPYLLSLGTKMHRAVGTSAAIGFPIALAGAAGYGVQRVAGPSHALGYIYLPALIGIAIPSTLCAPLGARLAHALPVRRLKRAFSVFLLLVAVKLAYDVGHEYYQTTVNDYSDRPRIRAPLAFTAGGPTGRVSQVLPRSDPREGTLLVPLGWSW